MSMIENESMLRLVEIQGRGRSLIASQPLKAGQIILKDSPILMYSAFPIASSYCDHCFKEIPTPANATACPSCTHLFCNHNCLTAAIGSSHSPWVCQALSRLRECPTLLSQPLECQIQARFLVAACNLALVSPSQFQALLSLQGQDSDASAVHFLHSLISSICPCPPLSLTVELTAALLAKDKMNAFGLMEPFSKQKDGERSVRAYGIYQKASFFNHDCLPNACRFDYLDSAPDGHNMDIIIRMIHDVPQGREICLSYFPVNLNYSMRQKRLLEDYGFTCDCDRCKVEANWSDNEAENIDDNENEEVMDEDDIEEMESAGGDNDFPHAYFFVRYMCSRENCWGTLAPLPPSDCSPSKLLECNVCGNLKNDEVC